MKKIYLWSMTLMLVSLSICMPAMANLYVRPAKLGILRLHLYPFSPAVAVREFTIGNTYNTSMQVQLEPVDSMEDMIKISETDFTLQGGENRTIEYTVTIKEPGYYEGGIIVRAGIDGQNSIGYQADLAVFVYEGDLQPYIYGGIGLVIAVVGFALIVYYKKFFKSGKKRG